MGFAASRIVAEYGLHFDEVGWWLHKAEEAARVGNCEEFYLIALSELQAAAEEYAQPQTYYYAVCGDVSVLLDAANEPEARRVFEALDMSAALDASARDAESYHGGLAASGARYVGDLEGCWSLWVVDP